jgi:hypothetical protein
MYIIRKQNNYDYTNNRNDINLKFNNLNEIYRNIEIIKKEIKEVSKESSLTLNELEDVRDFCRLILNSHNSGVYKNKDFTENRKKLCLSIYNYCCNPSK